eukprot:m.171469 g.171469  ORF g.171469 m.171469 type:complete len:482 (+) comp13379_c0_seq1:125-1570(+)
MVVALQSHSSAAADMRTGAEYNLMRLRSLSLINKGASTPWMVAPRIIADRSTFSMGLMLSTTTVSITDLSKQCVAAMSTWSSEHSIGKVPDRDRASRRSNARFFSVFCSSDRSNNVEGLAKSLRCCVRSHVGCSLMVVDARAASGSKASKRWSNTPGMLQKLNPVSSEAGAPSATVLPSLAPVASPVDTSRSMSPTSSRPSKDAPSSQAIAISIATGGPGRGAIDAIGAALIGMATERALRERICAPPFFLYTRRVSSLASIMFFCIIISIGGPAPPNTGPPPPGAGGGMTNGCLNRSSSSRALISASRSEAIMSSIDLTLARTASSLSLVGNDGSPSNRKRSDGIWCSINRPNSRWVKAISLVRPSTGSCKRRSSCGLSCTTAMPNTVPDNCMARYALAKRFISGESDSTASRKAFAVGSFSNNSGILRSSLFCTMMACSGSSPPPGTILPTMSIKDENWRARATSCKSRPPTLANELAT